jgi:hypothetical protein
MTINEITGGATPVQPSQPRKVKDDPTPKAASSDRVELSSEAKSLFEADRARRLDEVQKRIDTGFYTRRDVLEKVADAILRELV